MNKVLKNSWALFLGMGFLMMAYGFQGSLLGVRAVQEEFSLTATFLGTSQLKTPNLAPYHICLKTPKVGMYNIKIEQKRRQNI